MQVTQGATRFTFLALAFPSATPGDRERETGEEQTTPKRRPLRFSARTSRSTESAGPAAHENDAACHSSRPMKSALVW